MKHVDWNWYELQKQAERECPDLGGWYRRTTASGRRLYYFLEKKGAFYRFRALSRDGYTLSSSVVHIDEAEAIINLQDMERLSDAEICACGLDTVDVS